MAAGLITTSTCNRLAINSADFPIFSFEYRYAEDVLPGLGDGAGSLRLKAPRGVLVKPEKQKLPVLGAGESWTVTAKVQLTRRRGRSRRSP